MTNIQIDEGRDNEIVTFIGIPRKWVNPALKIYSFILLGYAIWIISLEFIGGTQVLSNRLSALFTHLAGFSVVEGLTLVAIIQMVDLIMYLTNKFKTKVKKQVSEAEARGKAEGKVEGKVEGKAEGREEIQKAWVEWNTRRIEAETRGIRFDEQPPTLPKATQDISE